MPGGVRRQIAENHQSRVGFVELNIYPFRAGGQGQ
jgi:hypothetical protein